MIRVLAVSEEQAAAKVAEADEALHDAFINALNAELVGANVSALISRLTEAGAVLTAAEVALKTRNYEDAVANASVCKASADGVAEDALALKNEAADAAGGWWTTVVSSFVWSIVFVVVLFVGWMWFRRYCTRRMLKSRPEVVS